MERDIRIQKFLSECGFTSRRKAEEMILEGRVQRNGRPVQLGDKLDPSRDVLTVDGERVRYDRRKKHTTLLLNKPRGVLTTLEDDRGRRTVAELVADLPARVYPVGRLDKNSEGLLILTDDGALANRIMHPRSHLGKTYRVTVRPGITEEQVIALSTGIELDGRMTLPATVRVLTQEPGRAVIEMVLREGRNRQIRRMCEALGLEIARLRRTAIGPIRLGMLRPGEWREMTPAELSALRGALAKAGGGEEA